MKPSEETDRDPEVVAARAASGALPEHHLELYKLAVEMADRVSARRATANGFFLTINTGLVALVGGTNVRWYVAAAGIVFSAAWWLLLKSYRKLNAAKFAVILEMEQGLSNRVFASEQRHYTAGAGDAQGVGSGIKTTRRARFGAWARKYRELGEVERIVPAVFGLIYVAELLRQAGL